MALHGRFPSGKIFCLRCKLDSPTQLEIWKMRCGSWEVHTHIHYGEPIQDAKTPSMWKPLALKWQLFALWCVQRHLETVHWLFCVSPKASSTSRIGSCYAQSLCGSHFRWLCSLHLLWSFCMGALRTQCQTVEDIFQTNCSFPGPFYSSEMFFSNSALYLQWFHTCFRCWHKLKTWKLSYCIKAVTPNLIIFSAFWDDISNLKTFGIIMFNVTERHLQSHLDTL